MMKKKKKKDKMTIMFEKFEKEVKEIENLPISNGIFITKISNSKSFIQEYHILLHGFTNSSYNGWFLHKFSYQKNQKNVTVNHRPILIPLTPSVHPCLPKIDDCLRRRGKNDEWSNKVKYVWYPKMVLNQWLKKDINQRMSLLEIFEMIRREYYGKDLWVYKNLHVNNRMKRMYLSNRKEFERIAKEKTKKYASMDNVKGVKGDKMFLEKIKIFMEKGYVIEDEVKVDNSGKREERRRREEPKREERVNNKRESVVRKPKREERRVRRNEREEEEEVIAPPPLYEEEKDQESDDILDQIIKFKEKKKKKTEPIVQVEKKTPIRGKKPQNNDFLSELKQRLAKREPSEQNKKRGGFEKYQGRGVNIKYRNSSNGQNGIRFNGERDVRRPNEGGMRGRGLNSNNWRGRRSFNGERNSIDNNRYQNRNEMQGRGGYNRRMNNMRYQNENETQRRESNSNFKNQRFQNNENIRPKTSGAGERKRNFSPNPNMNQRIQSFNDHFKEPQMEERHTRTHSVPYNKKPPSIPISKLRDKFVKNSRNSLPADLRNSNYFKHQTPSPPSRRGNRRRHSIQPADGKFSNFNKENSVKEMRERFTNMRIQNQSKKKVQKQRIISRDNVKKKNDFYSSIGIIQFGVKGMNHLPKRVGSSKDRISDSNSVINDENNQNGRILSQNNNTKPSNDEEIRINSSLTIDNSSNQDGDGVFEKENGQSIMKKNSSKTNAEPPEYNKYNKIIIQLMVTKRDEGYELKISKKLGENLDTIQECLQRFKDVSGGVASNYIFGYVDKKIKADVEEKKKLYKKVVKSLNEKVPFKEIANMIGFEEETVTKVFFVEKMKKNKDHLRKLKKMIKKNVSFAEMLNETKAEVDLIKGMMIKMGKSVESIDDYRKISSSSSKNLKQFSLKREYVLKHIAESDLIRKYKSYDYSKIDAHAVNLSREYKKRSNHDLQIVNEIIKPCSSELEKTRAIYRFICDFLTYKKGVHGSSLEILNGQKDGNDGKPALECACDGFAQLFERFCGKAKIKAVQVDGKTKSNDGKVIESPGHAWNMVVIEGKFFLVDATWSSGSNSKDKFNDFWWLTDPNLMIRSHFPDTYHYQLLKNPISRKQFNDLLFISSFGLKNDISIISNIEREKGEILFDKGEESNETFKIKFSNPNLLLPRIEVKPEFDEHRIFYYTDEKRKEIYVEISFPHNRVYDFEVYCGEPDQGNIIYTFVTSLKIRCLTISNTIFPVLELSYHHNRCELIEPKSGYINGNGNDSTCPLMIKVPHASTVVVANGKDVKDMKFLDKINDVYTREIEMWKFNHKNEIGIWAHMNSEKNKLVYTRLVKFKVLK